MGNNSYKSNCKKFSNSKALFGIIIMFLFAFLFVYCVLGVGYKYSGAAAHDLYVALVDLHGIPYENREVNDGFEKMEFSIIPVSFFATNEEFRKQFELDYIYECKVTYTIVLEGEKITTRTIVYKGIDPTGHGNIEPAYIDIESKYEK